MAKQPPKEYESLYVCNVQVPDHRIRGLDAEAVSRLAESMRVLGQQTPITVRAFGDELVLVAGLHRLRAAEALGWERIDAVFWSGEETDARLWEIAENLHRADLTVLERSEHVAEWVRLMKQKEKGGQLAHPVARQPHSRGISAATRELGIDRKDVQRSTKIDALSDEAKAAARETGRADNQAALLEAAKHSPEKQADAIRNYEPVRKPVTPAPEALNEYESEEVWLAAIMRVWNRSPNAWRERFLDRVQSPLFDKTMAGAA